MKVWACVSVYNPTDKQIENINLYNELFDKVIIYDNSLDNKMYVHKINRNYKYFYNGVNDGLCKCFNFAISLSLKNNVDYLCTLDQDSLFKKEDILTIEENLKNDIYDNCAIVAPNIVYQSNNYCPKNGLENVDWVICSGSFISLNILKKEKIRYDEYYFLDRFDRDICKQITDKGYKILVDNNSNLYQELGYIYKKNSNHTKIRHYYIFRNRFYYNNKYYNTPIKQIRNLLQIIKHISLIILNESDKLSKIKQLGIGYKDYKNGISGGVQ